MNLNRICLTVVAALASVLVACDDPKTIEGTVWISSNAGAPLKQAGVPVTMLPPTVRDALISHLRKFDSQRTSAEAKVIEDAVASNLASTRAEKSSVQRTLDEAILLSSGAKKATDAATEKEHREQERYDLVAAPFSERLRELQEIAKSIDARVKEQMALLATEQAKLDMAFAERKAQLEAQLAKAKDNRAREEMLLNDLKAAITKKRQELGQELAQRYSMGKIKIDTRIDFPCSNCKPQLCTSTQNTGDKAIASMTPQLFVNGKDVTHLIGDLLSIPSQWKDVSVLSVENEFKEKVEGLPPGGTSPVRSRTSLLGACSMNGIFLNSQQGDGKRAWDSIGGLSPRTKVEVRVGQATLADPKSLSNVGSGRFKAWRFLAEPPEKLFAPEVDALIDKTTKERLTERERAVESAEAEVTLSEVHLRGMGQPDRAASQPLVDAQSERGAIDSQIKGIDAELAALSEPLLKARENRQSSVEALSAADTTKVDAERRLQRVDAEIVSLVQKSGVRFDHVQANAKSSVSTSTIEKEWYSALLRILKDGDGITVQSDIDGRFRFERIKWKSPILFAISEQREEIVPAAPGRRSTTQRIPSYFWIDTVDTSKTTLIDLGQSSAVLSSSLSAVMSRVAVVSGLALPAIAAASSEKKQDDSETVCFVAHQASLLNPESLELLDFRQVPRGQIENLAQQEQATLSMLVDVAKLQCKREALPASLSDIESQLCATTKVSPNIGKYVGVLRAASNLGDTAKLYTFRAKASSRDGRQITHTGVCVIEANGKATTAQSDAR